MYVYPFDTKVVGEEIDAYETEISFVIFTMSVLLRILEIGSFCIKINYGNNQIYMNFKVRI